jgi:hypothetical protein
MAITDEEARRISVQVTQLRSGSEYRGAGRIIRPLPAAQLAAVQPKNEVYSGVRLQIGTWDQIARFVKDFSPQQLNEFFKGQPVAHMWRRLEPAVKKIRADLHGNYAKDFEDLANKYKEWSTSPDGQRYSTGDDPGGGVAMFC